MGVKSGSGHDTTGDIVSDSNNEEGIDVKVDYRDDLEGDIGVNLNSVADYCANVNYMAPADEIGVNLNRQKYDYDPEYSGGKYNPENSSEVKPLPEIAPSEPSPENELTHWPSDDNTINSLPGSSDELAKKFSKDTGNEKIDSVLDNFQQDNWSDLSLDEQKQSMIDLADYVAVDTGNTNPPEIVFSSDMPDGTYGGYNPGNNTMEINANMLDDSMEAADTIAHEMWHAHQEQAANDPNNPRAHEYQEGFDNYIGPEYDFESYQNQMVEAEAREYAQGFKDRIAG